MFRESNRLLIFFIGSLCALNKIPALKSLELPEGDTREFLFHNYHPTISFLGVSRGVEFVRNFFVGSLRAVKEISALKSLEMLIAAEREFFFCNYPPINNFLGVFRGAESASNFFYR